MGKSGITPAARCRVCKKPFIPHPRLSLRQKTCRETKCQLSHRAQYQRNYRQENRQAAEDCQSKQRATRGSLFWKSYRQTHPESTERNRANSRLRKRLKKAGLQRQLDIVELIDPIDNLNAVVEFATSHGSLLRKCLPRKCG